MTRSKPLPAALRAHLDLNGVDPDSFRIPIRLIELQLQYFGESSTGECVVLKSIIIKALVQRHSKEFGLPA